jgi:hypothetical protein
LEKPKPITEIPKPTKTATDHGLKNRNRPWSEKPQPRNPRKIKNVGIFHRDFARQGKTIKTLQNAFDVEIGNAQQCLYNFSICNK